MDRGIIEKGAAMLGTTVDELIVNCIEGMRACAAQIGLAGSEG